VCFSVMFIASLVVSLVVPLPLRICLAFACVIFIASLVVSLVVPIPLHVCLAFTCVMFIASLVSLVLYRCESALRFLLRRKEGAEQDRVFLGHSEGVMMESSVSVLRAGL